MWPVVPGIASYQQKLSAAPIQDPSWLSSSCGWDRSPCLIWSSATDNSKPFAVIIVASAPVLFSNYKKQRGRRLAWSANQQYLLGWNVAYFTSILVNTYLQGRAFFQKSLVSFSLCPSSLIQHLGWVKTVGVRVTFLQDRWNQQFRFIFVKSLQNNKGAVLPLMHLLHLGYRKHISANTVNTIPTLIHSLWLMNTLCLFVLKCRFFIIHFT